MVHLSVISMYSILLKAELLLLDIWRLWLALLVKQELLRITSKN